MRFIPITMLTGGEILATSITNSNMQVLMTENTILNTKNISRIQRYGIQSVYIKDDTSINSGTDSHHENIQDTIHPKVRQSSVYTIKNCIKTFDSNVKKQKKNLRYGDCGMYLCKDVSKVSQSLIEEIITSKNTNISMMTIKNSNDYYYEHSVNVAVLSIIIGLEIGLKLEELENLAYGALLADIGCNWIEADLLDDEEQYTEIETNKMQKHAFIGYDYINQNTTFNAHIKNIILQHHERIDGTGYPNHLIADDIHPLSKIVMIADVYDAMTSDRLHREAYTQIEAIEYIMANAGTLFDFDLANIFVRKIVPYPVGTYVLLSNGQKGAILKNTPNFPLRPTLRIFGRSIGNDTHQFLVNLVDTKNITIEKVIYSLSE